MNCFFKGQVESNTLFVILMQNIITCNTKSI